MIRFLLDLYSTDILALGDRFTKRVDFYYIADYLKIDLVDDEYVLSVQAIFGELLTHYRTLIEQATDDAFLIYDLSDQYIAAFHLEKFNFKGRPYWQTTLKSTTDIHGHGINKDFSVAELKSKNWIIDSDFTIRGNRDILLKGINWSLENLRLNSNPVEISAH